MTNVKNNNALYLYMYLLPLMHRHLMAVRHTLLELKQNINTCTNNVITLLYGNSPLGKLSA